MIASGGWYDFLIISKDNFQLDDSPKFLDFYFHFDFVACNEALDFDEWTTTKWLNGNMPLSFCGWTEQRFVIHLVPHMVVFTH